MKKLWISTKLADLYITEYKKFLMMGTLSKEMITPSQQVDHVWHLHLTMPHHYYELVKSIGLGYFDHTPTVGGVQQASQWNNSYKHTLKLYKNNFGNPPKEIWETIQARFSPSLLEHRYVDLHRLCNYESSKLRQKNS